MFLKTVSLVILLPFLFVSCYNTYYLSKNTFMTLQKSDTPTKTVKTIDNKSIVITEDTKLYVRSVGGRRYPITPFNFKMTKSQLVASDRDYILMADEIKSYEVDKLSKVKTIGLITLGGAAVVGFIVYMYIVFGKKQYGEGEQ